MSFVSPQNLFSLNPTIRNLLFPIATIFFFLHIPFLPEGK